MLPGLFISLALLGLAAIDPIGIAAMPILLVQQQPLRRSCIFLSGSFVSLVTMGLLFARGFGTIVLRFEKSNDWFVPSVEAIAGIILLAIAITVWRCLRTNKSLIEPSPTMVRRLRLGNWQLFILGAVLVAIQSVIDIVFVIAMIRVGQLRLALPTQVAAIITYALAALVLQVAVVVAYRLTPTRQRAQTLVVVHRLLAQYADQAVVAVSLVLGCALLLLAA
jgi:hypothetical protein